MDEEIQSVETEESVTPVEDNAPSSEITTEGNGEMEETPQEEPRADQRDWQAYARKLEAENKDFKSLYKGNGAGAVDTSNLGDEQAQALKILKGVIQEAVAPIYQELEASKANQVIEEFSKDRYVKTLGPEINSELDSLPGYMQQAPLADRLQFARAQAIAKNADKIAEINKTIGREQAYKNQGAKKAQAGPTSSPVAAGKEKQDLLERSQSMSQKEYAENYEAIQQAEREALGL